VTEPSYDPRRGAGGLDAEVARLEAQAALTWREESRLLRELGVPADATVLDVGCGPGAVLTRLRELVPAGALIGVEPDAELAALARARVPEAEILAGSVERLPLADGSVDVALARYLFQHLSDPVAAAREVRRVLRPGGLLAAIEVDGQLWGLAEPSFPEVAEIHAKIWLAQRGRGGDRMIGRRLPRILAEAGFENVAVRLYGTSSDEHSLDAFAVHLDPEPYLEHVESGTITVAEYAALQSAYARFTADPVAYVVLAGLVIAGRA
jgi:ubiquinone/menaquinone biosynthesis C-methylase UbiE